MRKAIGLVAVLFYVVGITTTSGLVYCQDASGHIAIEPVHEQGHCSHSHDDHDHEHDHGYDGHKYAEETCPEHPCAPCVDIPLVLDDHVATDREFLLDEYVLAASFSDAFITKRPQLRTVQHPIPPPRLSSTLANLRTVFLLV